MAFDSDPKRASSLNKCMHPVCINNTYSTLSLTLCQDKRETEESILGEQRYVGGLLDTQC